MAWIVANCFLTHSYQPDCPTGKNPSWKEKHTQKNFFNADMLSACLFLRTEKEKIQKKNGTVVAYRRKKLFST